MVAEDSYMHGGGPERGVVAEVILIIGVGPADGVAAEEGISLDISLVRKAGRLCSPFSRGYATSSGGGKRGRRRIDSKKYPAVSLDPHLFHKASTTRSSTYDLVCCALDPRVHAAPDCP